MEESNMNSFEKEQNELSNFEYSKEEISQALNENLNLESEVVVEPIDEPSGNIFEVSPENLTENVESTEEISTENLFAMEPETVEENIETTVNEEETKEEDAFGFPEIMPEMATEENSVLEPTEEISTENLFSMGPETVEENIETTVNEEETKEEDASGFPEIMPEMATEENAVLEPTEEISTENLFSMEPETVEENIETTVNEEETKEEDAFGFPEIMSEMATEENSVLESTEEISTENLFSMEPETVEENIETTVNEEETKEEDVFGFSAVMPEEPMSSESSNNNAQILENLVKIKEANLQILNSLKEFRDVISDLKESEVFEIVSNSDVDTYSKFMEICTYIEDYCSKIDEYSNQEVK